MYELKQGTERIITALYSIKNNAEDIKKLSVILNYIPEQLTEDIQALNDFISNQQAKRM